MINLRNNSTEPLHSVFHAENRNICKGTNNGIMSVTNIDVDGGISIINKDVGRGRPIIHAGCVRPLEVVLSIPTGLNNNSFLPGYDKKAVILSQSPKKQIFSKLINNRLYFYLT